MKKPFLRPQHPKNSTSWQPVSRWYSGLVDKSGHYFHQHVIFPKVLKLLKLKPENTVLDIGCGQGVFARSLPKDIRYFGLDISSSLIQYAKNLDPDKSHHLYFVQDATQVFEANIPVCSHAVIIEALQNMKSIEAVFQNVHRYLMKNGKLVLVLNHPYFRIPRQSSWEIDESNKIQYRRVNRYLTPLEIPIRTHPSEHQDSSVTWSFHYPLSYISEKLQESHFVMERIEEWTSDKISVGPAAKMENRSRLEFPMFMAISSIRL